MSQAQISACPGCLAAPTAKDMAHGRDVKDSQITLSLPAIHCAACISGVERALMRQSGVRAARVNLTLKRAQVEADDTTSAQELADALTAIGFEAYELDAGTIAATQTDRAGRAILTRIAVSGFAMMNVMLLSVAVWSGASDATRDMFHWISAAIAVPAVAYAAQPFFISAWTALRAKRLNMDVPISLAILLAVGMSIYEISLSGRHAYFDAALSLTFFLLAGRYLDYRTRSIARSAAEELAALEVPRATLDNGTIVPIGDLTTDHIVRVVPGARVPVDGIVTGGASELDRSLLTGETLPVGAAKGSLVSAGEVNLTGPLLVQVTAAGADSSLHRLADLVAMAETSRNRYTSLADRAARIYAPLVHLLALFAFIGWVVATGDVRHALNVAVAVLIITCPCALGLAVPAVTTAASGRLFRAGMLIKSATALERLAEVDTVVFDKTGTLTQGRPQPANWDAIAPEARSIVMAMAAGSAHPLSASLYDAARASHCVPADVSNVVEVLGQGIEAQWNTQRIRLGRAAWLGAEALGQTATYLQIGDQAPVAFTFVDHLRDGAEQAVAALKAQGKDVVLLSGDAPAAVANIAARVGIEAWEAECLPLGKALRVKELSEAGRKVLMIGDGLNDTAALAASHVSISPASALEATRVVSDIVLLGNSLAPIGDATTLAVSATRRIKENFAIAAGYNMIAIPIALAGFATPLAAALAMSTSSITVSLNALRLKGFK
ncbi:MULTISPECIES: heavy metal translocating P-type ATPase [Pacificibacter]|uniref:heavy metal translocating P-type ATPase n=1 Tax=Pacificibacter TaxID=1042323 RepID=UPI001C086DBD|nr:MULTISPECIES: heavy metal translocating P-type ATPase [Pacificibacter]MBU2937837.1 cadmium-translocating P-type ATPase [Pacificibacter marinus]MDO6616098.1 heavy metal translocating P-type ATPase [Pacificibacter sp. 1_MG-2023]